MYKSFKYLVFLLIFVGSLHAQENDYSVSKKLYTYQDGLPGRTATCVIQDKMGYLWVGTNNGLCRFDGNEFRTFIPGKDHLRARYVKEIISDDSLGILIIYAESSSPNILIKKIDVVNIYTLKVKPLADFYPAIPFKEGQVAHVEKEFGKREALFFITPCNDHDAKTFTQGTVWRYAKQGGFQKKKFEISKTIEYVFKNGKEIALTEKYNPAVSLENKSLLVFNDSSIRSTRNHSGQELFGDTKGFVYLFNEQLVKYQYISYKGISSPLDSVNEFYRQQRFAGWNFLGRCKNDFSGLAKEQNDDLSIFIPMQGFFKILTKNDDKLLLNAVIISFSKDQSGNYWLCTSKGLLKITIKQNKFVSFFTEEPDKKELSHSARGIYAEGDLFVAGLSAFFRIQTKNAQTDIAELNSFAVLKEGNTVWLGSYRLDTYDLITKKRTRKASSVSAEIWSIFRLSSDKLLLSTSNDLVRYDEGKNSIQPVQNLSALPLKLVYKVFRNKENQLIAVSNNGVFLLDDKGDVTDCYSALAKNKNRQLPFVGLNDLYIDKEGIYWLASVSDGLFRWDIHKNTFEQFGAENGFVSTTLYRIQEDSFDNLWVSTEFGLAQFNKLSKQARIYTQEDGLSENEFNRVSSYEDQTGRLYFGGLNGIIGFNPRDFQKEQTQTNYPFRINSYKRYNAKTDSNEDETNEIRETNNIILSDGKRNFTLSVVLLDFEERQHLYGYQIQGYSNEWNYTKDAEIRINDLPYGNYILHVKAQCSNGRWNQQTIDIRVCVERPFYKTWWFIVLIIVVAGAALITFIKWRIEKLKRETGKLEIKVEQRTVELKAALVEQIALLQEVHHRVKNNLQFISAMLQMQLDTVKDESNQAVLRDTSRRITSMTLVHEMLYNKDKLGSISLREYLNELTKKLNELMYQKDTSVKFTVRIDDVHFNLNDCVALGMITSEIISNSMKYAFAGVANPSVSLLLTYDQENNLIVYTLRDNGKGMDARAVNNGLGMRLIDIFARQLEGSYELKNDNGLVFVFKIPFIQYEK